MYEMDEVVIGLNAGKIWNLLNIHSTLTKHQLITKTNLSDNAFHAAIGWLSKENKIRKVGEFFCLGSTNLTEQIGTNAGIVFEILNELPYSVTPINELSVLSENELYQALGWLAREGKLKEFFSLPDVLTLDNTEEKQIFMEDDRRQLREEITNRNLVINDLTKQLTEKQTDFIQKADFVDSLHTQLNERKRDIQSISNELQIAQTHIHQLTEEVQILSEDLLHRNQIIQELTRQVTDHQNMLIERTDALERLQVKFSSSFQHPLTSTTDIHNRISHIQNLQNDFNQPSIQQMNDFPSETRLYNKTPPSLDFQTNQTISHIEQSDNIDKVHDRVDTAINAKKPFSFFHGKK